MGLTSSTSSILSDEHWEQPSEKHQATLYYFAGRGLADQIRWMLAASDISFTQKIIAQRSQLLKMSERQLPFGQLPLLQIDDIEIVQSQAIVRYLARRAHLQGKTEEEILTCDMIAETVRDLLGLASGAPFKRVAAKRERTKATDSTKTPENAPGAKSSSKNEESEGSEAKVDPLRGPAEQALASHLTTMKEKWQFVGGRFEAILRANNKKKLTVSSSSQNASDSKKKATVFDFDPSKEYFLVGEAMTYADVLVAHITTWFVEECGSEIVKDMPLVVHLQNQIISRPSIKQFIQSPHFFPLGDEAYVDQVS